MSSVIELPPLSPSEVKAFREEMGLTQEGLGLRLGQSGATVRKWEGKGGSAQGVYRLAFAALRANLPPYFPSADIKVDIMDNGHYSLTALNQSERTNAFFGGATAWEILKNEDAVNAVKGAIAFGLIVEGAGILDL